MLQVGDTVEHLIMPHITGVVDRIDGHLIFIKGDPHSLGCVALVTDVKLLKVITA